MKLTTHVLSTQPSDLQIYKVTSLAFFLEYYKAFKSLVTFLVSGPSLIIIVDIVL